MLLSKNGPEGQLDAAIAKLSMSVHKRKTALIPVGILWRVLSDISLYTLVTLAGTDNRTSFCKLSIHSCTNHRERERPCDFYIDIEHVSSLTWEKSLPDVSLWFFLSLTRLRIDHDWSLTWVERSLHRIETAAADGLSSPRIHDVPRWAIS